MAKSKPKAEASVSVTTTSEANAPELIGKSDIKRSALAAWRKLDTVIQKELSLIMKGDKEITASTAAAVIKFIEASTTLASSSEDLSAKDAQDRQQAMFASLTLPTFDDEDEQ
jgi:hypothetical protein